MRLIAVSDKIQGLELGDGIVRHLWQEDNKWWMSCSPDRLGRVAGSEIAQVQAPYPNGAFLLIQEWFGGNREYTAVKNLKVVGTYAVDNYSRGTVDVCAGNVGNLLGKVFPGSLAEWKKAIKAL